MSGFNDFKPAAGAADAAGAPSMHSHPLDNREAIDQAVARAHALRAAAIRRAAVQLMQTVASLWRRPRKIPRAAQRSSGAGARERARPSLDRGSPAAGLMPPLTTSLPS